MCIPYKGPLMSKKKIKLTLINRFRFSIAYLDSQESSNTLISSCMILPQSYVKHTSTLKRKFNIGDVSCEDLFCVTNFNKKLV